MNFLYFHSFADEWLSLYWQSRFNLAICSKTFSLLSHLLVIFIGHTTRGTYLCKFNLCKFNFLLQTICFLRKIRTSCDLVFWESFWSCISAMNVLIVLALFYSNLYCWLANKQTTVSIYKWIFLSFIHILII